MNSVYAGDSLRLVGTFQNAGGTLTAPTTVALTLVPPVQWGGVVPGTVTYTLAQGSVQQAAAGSYYYDLLTVPAGTYGVWRTYWAGSGDVNAVAMQQFNVYQGPRG